MVRGLQHRVVGGCGGHLRPAVIITVLALALAGCGSELTNDELRQANAQAVQLSGSPSGNAPLAAESQSGAPTPGTSEGIAVPAGATAAAAAPASGAARTSGAAATAGAAAAPTSSGARTPGATAPRAAPTSPGAAAGGTNKGSAVPAPAPGGATAAKSEIRLAMIGTQSGPIGAQMKPIPDAGRAWANSVNGRGGLDGHPVRLYQADDGGDPNRALGLVKQFVENEKVSAFFATTMVSTEPAVTSYLEQKQIPIIGNGNNTASTEHSAVVYHFGPGSEKGFAWAHLAGLTTLAPDLKKIGLIWCREVAACKIGHDHMVALAGQVGLTVVSDAQVSLAQPDYTAEVLAARNAGAEALIAQVDSATVLRIVRSANRQNWKPAISTQWGSVDDRMLNMPEAEGVYASSLTVDYRTDPRLAEYRAAIKATGNSIASSMGAMAWVGGMVLEKVAPALGSAPTGADFIRTLNSLRQETMGGLLPPTTFAPGRGNAGVNSCVIPVRIRKGGFDIPQGDRFACAPGWSPL